MVEPSLEIEYVSHERVTRLLDVITFCLEGISVAFDRWNDPYVRGPGLYVVVVAGTTVDDYADPMGDNRWPVEDCRTVLDDIEAFFETASEVAVERDGAVVVSPDGYVLEQMVRLHDLTDEELAALGRESLNYADWMGARHMSAVDTSAREQVVAAVTLSEETGRVTVFTDGDYDDATRDELGGEWRIEE